MYAAARASRPEEVRGRGCSSAPGRSPRRPGQPRACDLGGTPGALRVAGRSSAPWRTAPGSWRRSARYRQRGADAREGDLPRWGCVLAIGCVATAPSASSRRPAPAPRRGGRWACRQQRQQRRQVQVPRRLCWHQDSGGADGRGDAGAEAARVAVVASEDGDPLVAGLARAAR